MGITRPEYRHRVVELRRDEARAIFRRAIERGEIPADTKIEIATLQRSDIARNLQSLALR